ncbi:MAG: hypothetical protein HYX74_10140 [Acidobacteria bacterium]|nr:hypothetical protein [Acidobacteriota bacterium]
MKTKVLAAALTATLLWALTGMPQAETVKLSGKILILDAEDGSFLLKTEEREIRVTTSGETVYRTGETEIDFMHLKLNDTVRVTGERQGDAVEASEVVKEKSAGAQHQH